MFISLKSMGNDWKTKLGYMAFASLFTAVGMTLSPVTGQFVEEPDRFGDIECTSLSVIDEAGNKLIWLGYVPLASLEDLEKQSYADWKRKNTGNPAVSIEAHHGGSGEIFIAGIIGEKSSIELDGRMTSLELNDMDGRCSIALHGGRTPFIELGKEYLFERDLQ